VFTAVKILVEVFWVVTSFSVVVGYQRFRGPCCLPLQCANLQEDHAVSILTLLMEIIRR